VKTFLIKTFGCKVNQYESQVIREKFLADGYSEISNGNTPSVCVVNTCCVTENAERKSRQFINRLKKSYPDSKIIAAGCSVNLKSQSIKKADILISNEKKDSILPDKKKNDKNGISKFTGHTRAFVKIQDGCNQFCSYCIVPHVRGRSRSRNLDEIIEEIKRLVSSGHKEIVVTGIHVGDFDSFNELIEIIDKIPDLLRVRISSIEPQDMTEDLMRSIFKSKKICRHFHIPLQSGSSRILRLMNRSYDYSEYKKLIEGIARQAPKVIFTTDIIVGFPGETKEDFVSTCNAVKEIGFAKVHIFPYSKRQGAKAADFACSVSPSEIKRRVKVLEEIADESAKKVRTGLIGTIQNVLIENIDGKINGYTEGYIPVKINSNIVPNTFIAVKIIGQESSYLIGENC
jgi:threonylcarbamoyladenosine tRNA methylthiotransferase MtaB